MDENEAFASMMDVLRALYHWKEVVRSTAAVVRAVHASTVLQRTQIAARFLFTWRLAAFRKKRAREVQRAQIEAEERAAQNLEAKGQFMLIRMSWIVSNRSIFEWRSMVNECCRWSGCSKAAQKMALRMLSSNLVAVMDRWHEQAASVHQADGICRWLVC